MNAPKCWFESRMFPGVKCDQPAGHEGDHMGTLTAELLTQSSFVGKQLAMPCRIAWRLVKQVEETRLP